MKANPEMMPGTLDLLVLRILALEPQHGWAVARRIQQMSRSALHIPQGSLYPALYRLERRGWIKGEWRESETGRQARFYALTGAGRRHLEREREQWRRFSAAVNLIVEGHEA
jgi:transcriptional regulator